MRISQIRILDTFGTKSAVFAPGTVTRLTGANGSGKSSILRALAFVFEGGSDPSVIRNGAEKSVIEIRLDTGVVITKTTAPMKQRKARSSDPESPVKYRTELEITDADGTPMPAPQTYINELSKALAVDPSTLLRIDVSTTPGRKQLADTLMKLVPISFEPEEIGSAVAYRGTIDSKEADTVALRQSPEKAITLDEHKKLVAELTEQRRRFGITRDDADGAVNRLQKALPEGLGDGLAIREKIGEAEIYRRDVEKAISDRKLEIEREKAKVVLEAREALATEEKRINDDIDQRIRALEAERDTSLGLGRAKFTNDMSVIEDVAREQYNLLDDDSRPIVEKAATELQSLRDQETSYHRAAGLRIQIDEELATYRTAAWKYDRLTEVLNGMEALRLEKLNELPVRGLVVEDGAAYLDSVPWQNVNLARRVEAVLEICTQQTGKLPFIILDDSEHLDAETRGYVERGLAEAGYQLLEAMVTDGPLTIQPVDMPLLQGVA